MKKQAAEIYKAEQASFLQSITAAANGAAIRRDDFYTAGFGDLWGDLKKICSNPSRITLALWHVMGAVRNLEMNNASARSCKSEGFDDSDGSSQPDAPYEPSQSYKYVQNMDSILVDIIGENGEVDGPLLDSRLTVKMVENWKIRLEGSGSDDQLDVHLATIMGGAISANPKEVDDEVADLKRTVDAQEKMIAHLTKFITRCTTGVTANLGASSLAQGDSPTRPSSAG